MTKNNKIIYDFETGSKYRSQVSSIPLQIGTVASGGSYSDAQTTYFHPSLFSKDDGSKYTMDDLMYKDSAGTYQWRQDSNLGINFAEASEKGHKISAGSFRQGLDLQGKKIPMLETQEQLKGFLNQNIKGKHLTGFNSAGYDSFFLAKLLGAGDDRLGRAIQNLASSADLGGRKGASPEDRALAEKAQTRVDRFIKKKLGATQSDVMNDLDQLVYSDLISDGRLDYSAAGRRAKLQGVGGRKNVDWAKFFMGKENVNEELLHDAGYDVYVTGKVQEGASQLKKDVKAIRAAMSEGDEQTLANFYNSEKRSKVFGLELSFGDEIAAMKSAAKNVGVNTPEIENTAKTASKVQQLFENVQGGAKWFSKQRNLKKAGIIGGTIVTLAAGKAVVNKMTTSSANSISEEERKKRAMEERLYRNKPGSFVEY